MVPGINNNGTSPGIIAWRLDCSFQVITSSQVFIDLTRPGGLLAPIALGVVAQLRIGKRYLHSSRFVVFPTDNRRHSFNHQTPRTSPNHNATWGPQRPLE